MEIQFLYLTRRLLTCYASCIPCYHTLYISSQVGNLNVPYFWKGVWHTNYYFECNILSMLQKFYVATKIFLPCRNSIAVYLLIWKANVCIDYQQQLIALSMWLMMQWMTPVKTCKHTTHSFNSIPPFFHICNMISFICQFCFFTSDSRSAGGVKPATSIQINLIFKSVCVLLFYRLKEARPEFFFFLT